jgi:hypothetical protein
VAAQTPVAITARTKGRMPKNFPFFSRMREGKFNAEEEKAMTTSKVKKTRENKNSSQS